MPLVISKLSSLLLTLGSARTELAGSSLRDPKSAIATYYRHGYRRIVTSIAEHSLESIYRAHGPWLQNWLASKSRCQTRASDLVQETFCRLAGHDSLSLHAHPRRYLATVARRLLIDDVRRRQSERSFLDAFSLQVGGTYHPGPDRIAEAVEQLTAVAALLGELPLRVRRAFLLSRVDGQPYAEIALELGVSTSMVKQYVARAFAHCYIVAHGHPD